jgi:hypothetical protein
VYLPSARLPHWYSEHYVQFQVSTDSASWSLLTDRDKSRELTVVVRKACQKGVKVVLEVDRLQSDFLGDKAHHEAIFLAFRRQI